MQCTACGRDLPEASRFCLSCGAPVGGSGAPTFTSPGPARPFSTDPIDQALFIPGAILASRYRIVGLIGRGGMGEVYRAEDLKLAQPVALKFLPDDVATEPDRLARFHQEVRVARQVSHPTVCRVYDIGEADGRHFISMEYVDGEDLASLLRRIGRLPADKATELARQLCAGLAAAHDRGVLHRDLKPANVLVDGRGRVRIVDFGLAALAEDRRDVSLIAGTRGYMAPEQVSGGASTRTDVYALGLVLYEMFTGRPAFSVVATDLFARASTDPPPSPSTLVRDIDPMIERVILRCLERDPARRPSSALAVAAALPGGDPLAAALAAGETPPPEVVAAAGDVGSISSAKGLALLFAIVLGLVPVTWMSQQTTLPGMVPIDKGPEALADRARTIARTLGYADRPRYEEYGYAYLEGYLRYIATRDRSATRWHVLKAGRPASLTFWYRQSPVTFVQHAGSTRITLQNPPQTVPGMLSIRLDPAGRLMWLSAVPSRIDETDADARPANWAALFAETDLPLTQFTPATSTRAPPVYADRRAAWAGVYPGRPDIPVRIEAASTAGRPVHFEMVAPWTPSPAAPELPPIGVRILLVCLFALVALIVASALLLALRNFRLGRGDRRGAFRLGLFVLVISLLTPRHEASLGELFLLLALFSWAVFLGALAFLFYVAIEPHVRRVWPDALIGWCRLLAGDVRDPLVGRDILIGTLAGVVLSTLVHLSAMPIWFGAPPPTPITAEHVISDFLRGGPLALMRIATAALPSLALPLPGLLILVVLTTGLRSRRLAIAGVVLILTAIGTIGNVVTFQMHPIVALVSQAVLAAALAFLLVRFGLLATTVASYVRLLTSAVPLTLDSSAPYAGASYLMLATVLALAVYGFHTALAGRPIFGAGFLHDEPVRS